MIIHEQVELDYDDVLLLPHRSKHASRKEVDVTREFKFYHSPRVWKGTPIFCSNMATTGTIRMGLRLSQSNMCTALHKFIPINSLVELFTDPLNIVDWYVKDFSIDKELLDAVYQYCWYTTGIRKEDKQKLEELTQKTGRCPNIVIDVPNGYTDEFVGTCLSFREMYPEAIIMAGNVVTGPMVQELILHGGVDIVKIGIGSGANCSTRMVTGIGRPMISSIIECSHAAHGLVNGYESGRLGLVCADGGCKTTADINKGFAAGADFHMLGGMFAGCEENDGDWKYEYKTLSGHYQPLYPGYHHPETRKSKLIHYGMSSDKARENHYCGENKDYITEEGYITEVDYKGSVTNVIKKINGAIRSCGTYLGASRLKDFSKCAEFVKVNRIK